MAGLTRDTVQGVPHRQSGRHSTLRIALHDYGRFPFIEELALELRRRGHAVRLFFFAQNFTPNAVAGVEGQDHLEAIVIGRDFKKYSLRHRFPQERDYGRRLAAAVTAFAPDVVLSANAPLNVQAILQKAMAENKVPVVHWWQDAVGLAMRRIAAGKLPFLGDWLGRYFVGVEKRLLRDCAAVIAITEDFLPLWRSFKLSEERITVIHNWAPLIQAVPATRDWARSQGLDGKRLLLYSGTLGFKHDPGLFISLSEAFKADDGVAIVVVSEGPGADWLRDRKEAMGIDNLTLLPYQPYDLLPAMLASADGLMAILDEDAGGYCVPSKILTYLVAGKPILASVPRNNLAARILERSGAGLVAAPGDHGAFVAGAKKILAESDAKTPFGDNARRYAEENFAIGPIADRFEALLRSVAG